MRVQLAQQAQEILGQSDVVIITERVDDVALLIGQMVQMGLPEVLDRHIPRHWRQRGLSWGWTAVIWLAYIDTEGNKYYIEVKGRADQIDSFEITRTELNFAFNHAAFYKVFLVTNTMDKRRRIRDLGNIFQLANGQDFLSNEKFTAINTSYEIQFKV